MTNELISKYGAPVPRYTSYPTAPHFHEGIVAGDYLDWLQGLPDGASLSLYLHIPFCDTLCWFCGCNTKMVRRYGPVETYLPSLLDEIETVAAHVPRRHRVCNVHWGGGSPDILSVDDILRLADALRRRFRLAPDCEFAVEIDPRGLEVEQVRAFAEVGLSRVSVGVQDFDPKVQAAINRHQSADETRRAIERFRENGVRSVNVDLIYGLPRQTLRSTERTVAEVLAMAPDRIAIFGYAHLPAKLRHQKMIDENALPGLADRFAQASLAGDMMTSAGYERIGLDHFARPGDALSAGEVRRNFQGYTTDQADALLGLGASAIGRMPNGYVQNATSVADYARRVAADGVAVARGYRMTRDDEMRAFAIDRLMCDLVFPARQLVERFGDDASKILVEARGLCETDDDGLLEYSGSEIRVTEKGRPFLRTICAHFDAHLDRSAKLHSVGV